MYVCKLESFQLPSVENAEERHRGDIVFLFAVVLRGHRGYWPS